MRNPRRSAAPRTAAWILPVVALAATITMAPSITPALCVGDCNGDGQVTVNELIQMVNIALGNLAVSVCTAGDPNGDGEITVNEIVAGVNVALSGFCEEGGCGDGVKSPAEECDDGGICVGGTNAGAACTKESDCHGEGVCDSFGSQGPAGTIPRKVCSTDGECGGARCVHCKTFGGDGCAANCTLEETAPITLVPGVLNGSDITPGTSGAIVHGDILTIPLTIAGKNDLVVGKPDANGNVPVTQKVIGIQLDRIPVSTLACACVRGSVYKTCGGTQFEADGVTASTNCTSDASVCEGKKPCTAVAGPGNAGEGVFGCNGLPSANYTIAQDSGGTSGTPGPAIFTPGTSGGPSSQIIASASAIGTVVGLCEGSTPDYGPDGKFCTDDDPDSSRGTPSITTLVTGTASAAITNANGLDGNDIGPFSVSGTIVDCAKLANGERSGVAQAGAFTMLNQPTTGDIVVTNLFVTQ